MFSTLLCHGLSRSNCILADAIEQANGFPKPMQPVKSTTVTRVSANVGPNAVVKPSVHVACSGQGCVSN